MVYQGVEWDHIPATGPGTDLGIDNRDATDLDVTSSTGADATIPAATTTLSGLMTAADKTALNSALQPGDDISELNNDAGYITDAGVTKIIAGTNVTINPTTGIGDVTINASGGGSGATDLGIANRDATDLDVTSSTGADATIPAATTTLAGLFTAADKTKLDGIEAGAQANVNADLEYVPDANNDATITNTAGDDATVPIATDSVAGLFTGDEKQKLAGIEDGAAANQDLGYTADGNNAGTVTITDGTDATVPIVTDTVAGLMTGTQKQKLDGIEAGAQVNDGYSQAESDGRYLRIDAGAPDQTRVSGSARFASNLQTDGELIAPYANINFKGGRTGKVLGIYEGLSGDNATQPKISLNNDGTASFEGQTEHAGGVSVTGGDNNYDLRTNTTKSTSYGTYSIMSTPKQDGDTIFLRSYYSFPGVNSGTTDMVVHYYARQGTFTGTVTEQKGFAVDGNLSGATTNYGFHSNLKVIDGSQYNFYAIGEAPNYFAGNIDCDGLINGAFSLRMQTDDPTAFQTTYSTDEEGNQVEKQTYIGTTEDLLSIIKDLRARVDALEAQLNP